MANKTSTLENYNECSSSQKNGTIFAIASAPPDDVYEPLAHRNINHPTTDFGALAHLLKGSIGMGLLAMPLAFKNSGLATGAILTVVVGVICTHCCHILVKSSRILCKRIKQPYLTFQKVAEVSFETGPQNLRGSAKFAGMFINGGLYCMYFGVCCIYVMFVAISLQQLMEYYCDFVLDKRWYVAMLSPFFIIIGQIRNLKFLVPFSVTANIFLFASVCIGLFYCLQDIPPLNSVKQFQTIEALPFFFSTLISALENIGLIMPVENKMLKPGHLLGFVGILNWIMVTIILVYGSIGFFGFLKFKEHAEANFILNLPSDAMPGLIAKIMIMIAIAFTFGVQFYVPSDTLWSSVKSRIPKNRRFVVQTFIRFLVVIIVVLIAMNVPNVEVVIGLVGSLFISTLGVLVPVVIETVTSWGATGIKFNFLLLKNIILVAFWLMVFVTGTLSSVKDIVNKLS